MVVQIVYIFAKIFALRVGPVGEDNNLLMKKRLAILLLLAFAALPGIGHAQFSSVSFNALGYVTGNFNVAFDVKLNARTSLDVPISFSPLRFKNVGWQNITLTPGVRFWLNEIYQGSFFGVYADGSYYKILYSDDNYQGWSAGAGFSYGYSFLMSKRWNLEVEIGASVVYMDYTLKPERQWGIFEDEHWTRHRSIGLVPSKAKISFGYLF